MSYLVCYCSTCYSLCGFDWQIFLIFSWQPFGFLLKLQMGALGDRSSSRLQLRQCGHAGIPGATQLPKKSVHNTCVWPPEAATCFFIVLWQRHYPAGGIPVQTCLISSDSHAYQKRQNTKVQQSPTSLCASHVRLLRNLSSMWRPAEQLFGAGVECGGGAELSWIWLHGVKWHKEPPCEQLWSFDPVNQTSMTTFFCTFLAFLRCSTLSSGARINVINPTWLGGDLPPRTQPFVSQQRFRHLCWFFTLWPLSTLNLVQRGDHAVVQSLKYLDIHCCAGGHNVKFF